MMVELIYLPAGQQMPDMPDDKPWLTVEASDDGRFFGTGWGRKPTGDSVFYASLAKDDVSLEAAIAAATRWAGKQGIPRIWVQETPD